MFANICFITLCILSIVSTQERFTVYPTLVNRGRRESSFSDVDLQVRLDLGSRPLHLLLAENQGLSLEYGVIEWVHANGTVSKQPISDILKKGRSLHNGEEEGS